MYLLEVDLVCMCFEIKSEIAQQTDAETAVQIMFEHMMDHIKNIFCRRQNRIESTIDRLCDRDQIFRRIYLIYDLVGTVILVHSDYTVVQFQEETASCFWKSIVIGKVMIAEFIFLNITVGFQQFFCLGDI